MPAYEIQNLAHFYGEKQVLDIPELTLKSGSITGLIGPNGSGKSTLLKLLAFAMKPSRGTIAFKGRTARPFDKAVRSRVTLLTQKPYLLKRSVFDNLAYGLKIRKDRRDIHRRMRESLDRVGLDYDAFVHRPWHQLSGGEAQRVALAARLILNPEVLLLDEPVASVDTASACRIRQAALDARDRLGTTLIIASHDLTWLYDCSDTQLTLNRGKIADLVRDIRIPWPLAHPTGTVLVPAPALRILSPSEPAPEICLDAHITAMHLSRKTRRIITDLELDLPQTHPSPWTITLSLDMDTIRHWDLQPGRSLILGFDTQSIRQTS